MSKENFKVEVSASDIGKKLGKGVKKGYEYAKQKYPVVNRKLNKVL